MNECSIIIKERKNAVLGRQVFNLSLRMKTWKFWKAFSMQDILSRLVINLKEKDQVCYLLFSVETLPVEMCDSVVLVDNVRTVLSLASYYLTVYQKDPKKNFMGWEDGEEKHLLVLKENAIVNIAGIVSLISCRDFECYLIFDSEVNKDKLFKEIKSLHDNDSLKQKNIVSLSSEVIEYALLDWTNQLFLYTTRFDAEQIKNIVRDSVDLNKFKVVV